MSTPANPDDLLAFLRAQLDEDERRAARMIEFAEIRLRGRHPITPIWDEQKADADRMLAEVDAKRRILDLHAPVSLKATTFRPALLQCEHCADLCHSRSGLGCDEPIDAPWPCETVRLLALPFADRPGYREEWRPA